MYITCVQARTEAIDTSCQYSSPTHCEIGLQCNMLMYNPSSEFELSDTGIDTQHDSSFILSEESLSPPFPSTRKGEKIQPMVTTCYSWLKLLHNNYVFLFCTQITSTTYIRRRYNIVEGETVPEDVPAAPSPLCSGYM